MVRIKRRVNLDGTPKGELLKEQQDIRDALSHAVELMASAAPHGRDFQLNPEDFKPAHDEHVRRMVAVSDILQAYTADLIDLFDSV